MNDDLLTTAQAAKALGCDRATLIRWHRAGFIEPAYKVPGATGAYLWSPKSVEALQRQHRAQR